KDTPGQLNPFYCAMVEMLDHYVGDVFQYLETTDDPRWPGHKLSENTYVFFTSDNGGMEGGPSERYTDNSPLDMGKISAKEGGTRVPLMIAGPGIPQGVQTNVVANGLDFYPTILKLTNSKFPQDKPLDGCDLSALLLGDPTNPALVKTADGKIRDTMVWHFPHGVALESTIRIGDYKLIRNYDHVANEGTPELELFRLYESGTGQPQRVDVEEANNLATSMPEKTAAMNAELTKRLTEMQASYPSYNPNSLAELPGKEMACQVVAHKKNGNNVQFTVQVNGAEIRQAHLLYTLNGGERYEEWFRKSATLHPDGKVTAELPEGTTQYVINLIDENNFLRSYPEISGKGQPSESALSVAGNAITTTLATVPNSIAQKDTNEDGKVSKDEYIEHTSVGFDHKDKNKDGVLSPAEHTHASFTWADQDQDGQLTRAEFMSIFERQFASRDKNKDGYITADEMTRKK
ncbi:MAG: sulfatase-like hydrolase/transferase, partial [Pirellulaceae bacterium]